jgi:hypothetical protein
LEELRDQLQNESSEFGRFFEKLIEVYYTYDDGYNKVESYDTSRYEVAFQEVNRLKIVVQNQIKYILELRQDLAKAKGSAEKFEKLALMATETKKYQENEKKLRLLEAHLHIFTTFIERSNTYAARMEKSQKWGLVVGLPILLGVSLFSSFWLKIPFLLQSDVFFGGDVMDGLTISCLAAYPCMLGGQLMYVIRDVVRPFFLEQCRNDNKDGESPSKIFWKQGGNLLTHEDGEQPFQGVQNQDGQFVTYMLFIHTLLVQLEQLC